MNGLPQDEETDYDSTRRACKRLRYEAARARSELEQERLNQEPQLREFERTIKEQSARIEKLEKDRRFLFEKEKEATAQSFRLEEELQRCKEGYELKLRQLRVQHQERIDRLLLSEDDDSLTVVGSGGGENETVQHLREEVQLLNGRVRHEADTACQLRDQLTSKTQHTEALARSLEATQRDLVTAERELADLRARQRSDPLMDSVRGDLRHQVVYIKQLETKIRNLQKEVEDWEVKHENFELAREQQGRLEHELELLRPLRERVTDLEMEAEDLRHQRDHWESTARAALAGTGPDASTPAVTNDQQDLTPRSEDVSPLALSRTIAQQRREISGLRDQLGQLRAQMAGARVENEEQQRQLGEAQTRVTALEQQRSKDKRTLQRLEKLRALAQREVDFLREQLKSYDMEDMTTNLSHGGEEGGAAHHDAAKTQRIQGLEELTAEYRDQIQRLTEQLATQQRSASVAPAHPDDNHRDDAGEAEALRRELSRLEKRLETQDRELALLEHKVGQGDYNPRTTRVLQLADNPTTHAYAIRESTLQSLRQENAALLQQLMAAGGGATTKVAPHAVDAREGLDDLQGPLVPQQTVANLMASNAEMTKEVAEKEKRMTRLKEVWRAKAQEMREAVFSLLGYRVDFLENGRVRLVSMYGEAEDHSFIFTSDQHDAGTLELAGGGNAAFVRSLDSLIQFWVVERRSIPAFLATVTLELFDRTTAMMPPGHQAGWRGREEIDQTMTLSSASGVATSGTSEASMSLVSAPSMGPAGGAAHNYSTPRYEPGT